MWCVAMTIMTTASGIPLNKKMGSLDKIIYIYQQDINQPLTPPSNSNLEHKARDIGVEHFNKRYIHVDRLHGHPCERG